MSAKPTLILPEKVLAAQDATRVVNRLVQHVKELNDWIDQIEARFVTARNDALDDAAGAVLKLKGEGEEP